VSVRRVGIAVLAVTVVGSSAARAADSGPPPAAAATPAPAPGADQIQFAAREHDLGYRAYTEKQFEEAATHFENAFFAAPNPAELRSAIRARRDAGQLARAATLAAIGERRFPGDPATSKIAADTIAAARPRVQELHLASETEYGVAIDEKVVASGKVKDARVFVDPGSHELVVSWPDDRSTRISIDAQPGGTRTIQLEPPPPEPPPSPPSPPPPAPVPPPAPASTAAALAPAPPQPAPTSSAELPPAVFFTGAGLTLVGAGLSVWQWVYAYNNPGRQAVINDCTAAQGTSCSLYEQGVDNQNRAYAIIGVTAGLGVATGVIGLFFTRWSSPSTSIATPTATVSGVSIVPTVGLGGGGVEGTF
jgi:hypothetical protein